MPLSDRDYMRRTPPPSRGYHRGRGYEGFVINPVWVLIGLNLLFFIVTTVNPTLRDTLAVSRSVFPHKPWTIITAMFTHYDFWHIFGNMITLYFFGMSLYRLIGQNKFLLVYFVGGIIGNLLFIVWPQPSFYAVIGASGAIFAVAGTLAVIVPRLQVRIYFVIPMPLWAVVIIFFGIWSIPGFISGVAWQAHLGGLITGLVAGYFFRRSRQRYYIW